MSLVIAVRISGLNLICIRVDRLGALDLNPKRAVSGVEDEIVSLTVSPGFGNREAEARGFDDECSFREFPRALGVGTFPAIR